MVATSTGAMALLSGAHDGSLVSASQILGPTVAFAQEGASDGLTEFSFDVVCVDEVGIHVVDITKKNEKGDPADVPGATVIIKSLDFPDKNNLQKHADDEDKCIFNINDYCAKDESGQPEGGIYQCNVSITISFDDQSYCKVAIPSMLLVGRKGYRYTVQPYEGKPYLLSVAFNKQDILYNACTFLRDERN